MTTILKQFGLLLTLLLCVGGSLNAIAADENREADHAALRALRDKVTQAIDSQDIKALASCFAKEFAFTAVNQTVLTNETQMQEFFDQMFHSKDALVTSMKTEPKADILTRFVDANTGVCFGSSKDTYTMKSGKVVEMNVRWSATVVKENGEWKVAIAHVGTDFLSNPVLEGVEKFTKVVGLVAGVIGLLVGLLAGRLLGRAKKPQ
ncbi:MAG: nuclear transport factor 2 family protein [Verrucomicrobiota bacterium]